MQSRLEIVTLEGKLLIAKRMTHICKNRKSTKKCFTTRCVKTRTRQSNLLHPLQLSLPPINFDIKTIVKEKVVSSAKWVVPTKFEQVLEREIHHFCYEVALRDTNSFKKIVKAVLWKKILNDRIFITTEENETETRVVKTEQTVSDLVHAKSDTRRYCDVGTYECASLRHRGIYSLENERTRKKRLHDHLAQLVLDQVPTELWAANIYVDCLLKFFNHCSRNVSRRQMKSAQWPRRNNSKPTGKLNCMEHSSSSMIPRN